MIQGLDWYFNKFNSFFTVGIDLLCKLHTKEWSWLSRLFYKVLAKTSGNISSVNRFWTPLEKNIKYLILKNTGHPVQTPIKLVTGIWHVNAFLFSQVVCVYFRWRTTPSGFILYFPIMLFVHITNAKTLIIGRIVNPKINVISLSQTYIVSYLENCHCPIWFIPWIDLSCWTLKRNFAIEYLCRML